MTGVNWDVEDAVRLFSVLRGASPAHHSGSVRSAPSKFTPSVKPPVAPKPVFEHKPSQDTTRLLADTRGQGGPKLAPLPPPRARKMGALPKIHQEVHSAPHGLPPVAQEVLPIATLFAEPYHPRGIAAARSNNLPPIQKTCQTDFCSPQSSVLPPSMPSLSKPSKVQSGSAKNALLIEKVRGTGGSLQEGQKGLSHLHHHSPFNPASTLPQHRTSTITTTTTAAAAAASVATAIDPSHITINSSCIISINNPNNNTTTRNNNIYPDEYSASSDSGKHPKPSHTTNSPYNYAPHLASRDSPPPALSIAVPSTTPSCIIIPSSPPQETQEKTHPKGTQLPEKSLSRDVSEETRRGLKAGEEGEGAGSCSSGPSLSAPCSPAKPLLRKTEAVDLEEYDYCECVRNIKIQPNKYGGDGQNTVGVYI